MIRKSIDSLLSQTYKNIEIIIVDNGSTDNTPEVLNEFRSPKFRDIIRIFRLEENRRFAGGANYGLDQIRGEWFTILDDDDLAYPDALETMLKVLDEVDPTITAINCNCIDSATGELSGKGPEGDQYLSMEDTMTLCKGEFWGLTKSELLRDSRFNARLLAYDSTFWYQINQRAKRYYIHKPLRLYVTDHGPTDSQYFKRKDRVLKTTMHRVLLEEPIYWESLANYVPRELRYVGFKGFLYMYMDDDKESTKKYLDILVRNSKRTYYFARLLMLVPSRVYRYLYHVIPLK
ncbi:MAG: glycosyltransferase family 2 protein [Saprospiraceae bacterium]|nr:glycosyltransferase family 2 protein [Saprospiraceae bacterium]